MIYIADSETQLEETLKLLGINGIVERRSLPDLGGIFRKFKKGGTIEKSNIDADLTHNKTYLKAMPLRNLSDLDTIKNEVSSGNILIIRIIPLANKSIEDVKRAVNELCEFVEAINGDIARLGEERVVVCPPNIKIWREKTSISNSPLATAA